MRCILPYHEHNYFARAIQMFRLNEKNSNWAWLKSPQVKVIILINGVVNESRFRMLVQRFPVLLWLIGVQLTYAF